jgi:D-alanyl-D-alanine dipeptidase
MDALKAYRSIQIIECGEAVVAIPQGTLVLADPHPYAALGAPYGAESPWVLRESILESLLRAQANLQICKPGWRIYLHDAYRPNAVQRFMVEHEFKLQAAKLGKDLVADREELAESVFRIWSLPSDDAKTPPPHSTGAAFDCSLIDEKGRLVEMGSAIDENSERSEPDHFAAAADAVGKLAHANRGLLNELLQAEKFLRHPGEWWHFSRGDQFAVWLERAKAPQAKAIYGRVDLISHI